MNPAQNGVEALRINRPADIRVLIADIERPDLHQSAGRIIAGYAAIVVVDAQDIDRLADQLHIPFRNMQLRSRLPEPFYQKSRILPLEHRVHEPFQEPAGLPSASLYILFMGAVRLHPGYIRRIADHALHAQLPEQPHRSAVRHKQMMGYVHRTLQVLIARRMLPVIFG
ncbi:hypothetical protein D3C73_1291610 [compost metagenome]